MVHFLWKVGDWFPKWRGGSASFARQPFFLLDSQVIQIFCLKNRLIILRAVTYVIRGGGGGGGGGELLVDLLLRGDNRLGEDVSGQ